MPRGLVRSTGSWRALDRTNGPDCTGLDPTADDPSDQIEAVLRRAFDLSSSAAAAVSGGMGIKVIPGPSPGSVSVELSDALTKLVLDICGGGEASRERVEGVVCRLLNERMRTAGTKARDWAEGLAWLRERAVSPCDSNPTAAVLGTRWGDSILDARRALFKLPAGAWELPYYHRKKRKGNPFLSGESAEFTNSHSSTHSDSYISDDCEYANGLNETTEMLNMPRRRSGRTLGLLKLGGSDVLRKRIPIGPFFQADIPEWVGPSNWKNMADNDQKCESRWLGTRLWPIEGKSIERGKVSIGSGRPDFCSCCSPSSTTCTRYHARMTRIELKSDLGHAFVDMGFENMGDEVSNLWSCDQQREFNTLVTVNPISENKTFWDDALRSFPSKTRQDIVSYYFNVYVPRRMSFQTKLPKETVDSDDDEWSGKSAEALLPTYIEARHS